MTLSSAINSETLVFIPTYNEAGNIGYMANKILAHLPDADLLIVDDASPDGTTEVVKGLMVSHEHGSRLRILTRAGKMGIGSAHRLAMMYALFHEYQYLITMDGDGSHEPESLPDFRKALDSSDFVIGSRFLEGSLLAYEGYRGALSRGANFLLNNCLGMDSTEFTTAYRGFRCDWLRDFPFFKIQGQGYNFFFQCLYWVRRYGARYAELPIQFHNRREGESKINLKEILIGVLFLAKVIGVHLLSLKLPPVKMDFHEQCSSCCNPYLEMLNERMSRCLVCGQEKRT